MKEVARIEPTTIRIDRDGCVLGIDPNGESVDLVTREGAQLALLNVERALHFLPDIERLCSALTALRARAKSLIADSFEAEGRKERLYGGHTFALKESDWAAEEWELRKMRADLLPYVGDCFTEEELDAALGIEVVPAHERIVAHHGRISRLAAKRKDVAEIIARLRRRKGAPTVEVKR